LTIDQLITEVRAQRNLPPPTMRRAIRQAAGVSMPRLAGALGVSTPTLHHWEIGTRNRGLPTPSPTTRRFEPCTESRLHSEPVQPSERFAAPQPTPSNPEPSGGTNVPANTRSTNYENSASSVRGSTSSP